MANARLQQIMELDVTNLKKRQREALLEHILDRTAMVHAAIKNNDWEAFDNLTFNSPSGDRIKTGQSWAHL